MIVVYDRKHDGTWRKYWFSAFLLFPQYFENVYLPGCDSTGLLIFNLPFPTMKILCEEGGAKKI